MTPDREQTRRDAERFVVMEAEPSSSTALLNARDLADACLSLLAELEQAERARDEAQWKLNAVNLIRLDLEARLTKVPALVEAAYNAQTWIENYPLNLRDEFNDDWRAIADALRSALSAYEQEQA